MARDKGLSNKELDFKFRDEVVPKPARVVILGHTHRSQVQALGCCSLASFSKKPLQSVDGWKKEVWAVDYWL